MSYLTYYSKPQLNSIINSVFPEVFSATQYQTKSSNFSETDSHYVLSLDLPGFDKNEIELSTEKQSLHIDAKNDDRSYSNTYNLGDLDYESIEADLTNGVLTIEFKKSESTTKQVISLK